MGNKIGIWAAYTEGMWPMGMGKKKQVKTEVTHIPILIHFYPEDEGNVLFWKTPTRLNGITNHNKMNMFTIMWTSNLEYVTCLLQSEGLTIAVLLRRHISVKKILNLSHDRVSTFWWSFHTRNHIIDWEWHVSYSVVATVTETCRFICVISFYFSRIMLGTSRINVVIFKVKLENRSESTPV